MAQADSGMGSHRSNEQLLLIGGAVMLVVVMVALTIALVLIFALRSDVAVLEDQARKSAKAAKAMQEEMSSLREHAATLTAASRRTESQPVNIDGVNTATDCVIRPGSKNSVAECMQLGPGN